MTRDENILSQAIAESARAFQKESTGHIPKSVSVVLKDDTLVITLQEALTEAEKALAKTPNGAIQVQDYHRQLFQSAAAKLRLDIERITGRKIREVNVAVNPKTGAIIQAFTTGTVVQVFLLDPDQGQQSKS
jgi:uncharacterized protein YbcI